MKKLTLSLVIAAAAALMLTQCDSGNKGQKSEVQDTPVQATSNEEKAIYESVERGEYLVRMIGCDHCHTPKKMTDRGPVPDMDRWLMGYPADQPLPEISKEALGQRWMLMNGDLTAAVGPWGVSFAGNLTSDETGIGNWSYEQFKRAMTEGKYKGQENGRMLLPPMPWPSWIDMDEVDLKSIYMYLKSTKPIKNTVPAAIPPTDI